MAHSIVGKDKLKRFAEIEDMPNVFQVDCGLKGKWHSDYFKNGNPIVLELACGKGEYTVNMARFFSDKNFIGIDIKGARMWRGAKTGIEENLSNLAFLRIQIELLQDYFAANEVDEIWITFPDPHPTQRRHKKRLTYQRYLDSYRSIIKKEGIIHLKTDNKPLVDFTLEQLEEIGVTYNQLTYDLYNSPLLDEVLSIKTTYEKIYLEKGMPINYLQFSLTAWTKAFSKESGA